MSLSDDDVRVITLALNELATKYTLPGYEAYLDEANYAAALSKRLQESGSSWRKESGEHLAGSE